MIERNKGNQPSGQPSGQSDWQAARTEQAQRNYQQAEAQRAAFYYSVREDDEDGEDTSSSTEGMGAFALGVLAVMIVGALFGVVLLIKIAHGL